MALEDALVSIARACAQQLAQAIEAMAGESPQTSVKRGIVPLEENGEPLRWHRYTLNLAHNSHILAGATQASSTRIGVEVLTAAGVDNPAPEDALGTYLEVLNQAMSGVVRMLSSEVGREVTADAVSECPSPQAGSQAHRISVKIGGHEYTITLVFSSELEAALKPAPTVPQAIAASTQAEELHEAGKPMDLLLDVELPVSVSFGRAQLLLKDVLKLTTGSIVELNRTVSEPVEVIVNNCVIARGEVVVVEGNFGVRIQQVVSRLERIRTLK